MTQDEIIELAMANGISIDANGFVLGGEVTLDEIVKFGEIIQIQAQPTPSQSEPVGEIACDERTGHCLNLLAYGKYPTIGTELYTKPQPTPSQSEQFKEHSEYGIDGVYKDLPIGTKLYTKISKPQPTPSQSVDGVAWNFEYDQLTEEFIHELDDKTAMSISGFNRGYWAQYFNTKPQPTSQDAEQQNTEANND